jgi:hypothetical protein
MAAVSWSHWHLYKNGTWIKHEVVFIDDYVTPRILCKKVKVKGSRNRPGVAQRVPGNLGSQISMTFGTWRWWGCQPHAPAAFTSRKCSWYSVSLGAESTPGSWYDRKEYVTEKSSNTTGNGSRDRPTSSAEYYKKIQWYKFKMFQPKKRKHSTFYFPQ